MSRIDPDAESTQTANSSEHETRRRIDDYSLVFDQAPDAILVAGPDGRILDANARAIELLGYSEQELISRTIPELTAPDILEGVKSFAGSGEQSERSDRPILRKDGSLLPCEIAVRTLADGRSVWILRDVAERKRSEIDLQRTLSLLGATLDSTADGILAVDE